MLFQGVLENLNLCLAKCKFKIDHNELDQKADKLNLLFYQSVTKFSVPINFQTWYEFYR